MVSDYSNAISIKSTVLNLKNQYDNKQCIFIVLNWIKTIHGRLQNRKTHYIKTDYLPTYYYQVSTAELL